MKFFLNKILATFGHIKAMERTHVDNYTEDIINSIKEQPFALSDENVMYAGLKELAGYYYFKTIIVGTFKVKTFKGAKLNINLGDTIFELQSDMLELESDFSNVSNRFITSIDFEIEKDQIEQITPNKILNLKLLSKKQVIIFKVIKKLENEA